LRGLRPDDRLRSALKKPLGTLLRGSGGSEYGEVARAIEEKGIRFLISVGDVVSKDLIERGIDVSVRIVDGRVMRKEIEMAHEMPPRVLRAKNPPGIIGFSAWSAIRDAISGGGGLVLIEGEEDLLALPAIVEAPDGALVIYGQPNEGIVVVEVDRASRDRAKALMEMMEPIR